LPDFYIGNYKDNIELIEKIKEQISLLKNEELQESVLNNLKIDVEILTNYKEWRETENSDFAKWGKEKQKRTRYGQKAYYYTKNRN